MAQDISVIIPVYNRTELLQYVVNSVLGQTLPVLEVILVDDGSEKHVEEVVRRNMAENSDWRRRVVYLRQENQGQSVALNNGIAHARGEWISFGADDDFFLPHKLEWQFQAIEKFQGQCAFCFTDAWFMNNPSARVTIFQLAGVSYKEPLGIVDDLPRFLKHQYQAWVQTVVARKDVILSAGGLDPLLRYSEDLDFVFRMSLATKFCYVNMPLVVVDRRPPHQRHVGHAANWNKEDFRLRMDQRRYEKSLKLAEGLEPEIRRNIKKNLQELHSNWANLYLAIGEDSKALDAVSQAAKYGFKPNIALKWALIRCAPRLARKAMSIRDRLKTSRGFR